jgi:hypothetical protein
LGFPAKGLVRIAFPKWVERRALITVSAAQGPFDGFEQCQPYDSG